MPNSKDLMSEQEGTIPDQNPTQATLPPDSVGSGDPEYLGERAVIGSIEKLLESDPEDSSVPPLASSSHHLNPKIKEFVPRARSDEQTSVDTASNMPSLPADKTSVSDARLMKAIEQKSSHEMILTLLRDESVNIFYENEQGQNVLHAAARHGDVMLIDLLLSNGVDSEHKDKNGQTPLDIARQDRDKNGRAINLLFIYKRALISTKEQIRQLRSRNKGADTYRWGLSEFIQGQMESLRIKDSKLKNDWNCVIGGILRTVKESGFLTIQLPVNSQSTFIETWRLWGLMQIHGLAVIGFTPDSRNQSRLDKQLKKTVKNLREKELRRRFVIDEAKKDDLLGGLTVMRHNHENALIKSPGQHRIPHFTKIDSGLIPEGTHLMEGAPTPEGFKAGVNRSSARSPSRGAG